MNRELARKLPANAVNLKASEVRISGESLAEVGRKATNLYRAGRIEPDYVLVKESRGRWHAVVTLTPERTWWQRNRVRAVVLGTTAATLLAGLYSLVAALLHALAVIAPYAIGFLIVASALTLGFGRRVINITQNVSVK